MAWRAMPRCNNMSLRRTKSKVPMTPERHFRNTDAYLSRGFLSALTRAWPSALEALDSQGKTAFRLFPCPIPKSLNSRPFSPLHTLWLTRPERSFCRISAQVAPLTIKEATFSIRSPRPTGTPKPPSAAALPRPTRRTGSSERSSARLRTDAEYCWFIDPIDGTRAFILGLPLWGTLIGLTRGGSPLLGLMDQPFTRERFWSGETEFLLPS